MPGGIISLQKEREREKENFWTVVLDTINYIYYLKLNTLGNGWETTSAGAFVGALYLWKEEPPGDLGTRLPN